MSLVFLSHAAALPLMGRGYYGCKVSANNDNTKFSNLQVVTHWPLKMPVDPAYTIGGTPCVGKVLGEGRVSLAGHVCPHVLCEGTSTDDS